jgi:TPR repeat protein
MSSQGSNPKKNNKKKKKKIKSKKTDDGGADVHDCPICLERVVGFHDGSTRMLCCGKPLHLECWNEMKGSSLSEFQQVRCVLCRTPYPVPGSPEKKAMLQNWMDKGKGWAYTNMAQMHLDGEGFPQSAVRGFKLNKIGASLGDARAQECCAIAHRAGQGAPQSDALARNYNEMAAAQGVITAQYNLGTFYKNGIGGPVDYEKAKHWLAQAAMQGDEEAQFNLGNTFLRERDYQSAEKFLSMAAKRGMASAQHNLGSTLLQQYYEFMAGGQYKSEEAERQKDGRPLTERFGGLTVQTERSRATTGRAIANRALRWFHRAAAQGEAQAKMQLAICGSQFPQWEEDTPKGGWLLHARILNAQGAELAKKREYVRAIECWVEAAYRGHTPALHNLGKMYEMGGTLCAIDHDKAKSYYRQASDLGSAPSQINLGCMYAEEWEHNGRQKAHLDKAQKYWSLAATQTQNLAARAQALKNLSEAGLCVLSSTLPTSSCHPAPLCSMCGAPPSESNIIKNCPCHTTRYCIGKQCQRKHWKSHKSAHRSLMATRSKKV